MLLNFSSPVPDTRKRKNESKTTTEYATILARLKAACLSAPSDKEEIFYLNHINDIERKYLNSISKGGF